MRTLCRANWFAWFLGLLFSVPLLLGILDAAYPPEIPCSPTGCSDPAPPILIVIGLSSLAAACWFWALTAQVVADEAGVRWRYWGITRFALWSDVSDAYTTELATGRGTTLRITHLETTAGHLRLYEGTLSNLDALRERIHEKTGRNLWFYEP